MKKWERFCIMEKLTTVIADGQSPSSNDLDTYEKHWYREGEHEEASYLEWLKSDCHLNKGDYYSAIKGVVRSMEKAGDDMHDYSKATGLLNYLANRVAALAENDFTNTQVGICYEALKDLGAVPFSLHKYAAAHFYEKGDAQKSTEILSQLLLYCPNEPGVKELWDEIQNKNKGEAYEFQKNRRKNKAA